MGGKKKSIEARVLKVFERLGDKKKWRMSWHVNSRMDGLPVTDDVFLETCARLAQRGKLERWHDEFGYDPLYRLPQAPLTKKKKEQAMGTKKKSIEERVLEAFERLDVEWYTPWGLQSRRVLAGLSEDQVAAACRRLAEKGKLEVTCAASITHLAGPRYRLLPLTEKKKPLDEDPLETAVMAYFKRYPGTCGPVGTFGLEIVAGRQWTIGDVHRVCNHLADQSRLMHAHGVGYFLPGAKGVPLTLPDTRPSFSRALTAPLDGRIKTLVAVCKKALYPDVANMEVTEENLADQITLLRKNRDQLKQFAKSELEERHAAEQKLVDEQAKWQKAQGEVVFDHAVAEKELEELQAKLAALDACYRGLFGKREGA